MSFHWLNIICFFPLDLSLTLSLTYVYIECNIHSHPSRPAKPAGSRLDDSRTESLSRPRVDECSGSGRCIGPAQGNLVGPICAQRLGHAPPGDPVAEDQPFHMCGKLSDRHPGHEEYVSPRFLTLYRYRILPVCVCGHLLTVTCA